MQTVDAESGEVIKTEAMSWGILPPASDKCPVCATEHGPAEPHNAQSLYYQMAFRGKQGRFPTWADAIAHCEEPLRIAWREELTAIGAWTEPQGELKSIAHLGEPQPIKEDASSDMSL